MTPAFPWQAVLFDFGGTLDGDGVHWSRRFDRVFRAQGLDYPDAALQRAFRASEDRRNADPRVASQGLAETIEEQAGMMLRDLGFPEREHTARAAAALTAETRDYLARNGRALVAARVHARVGILSNFTGNLEKILREEGLLPLADAVHDSAVVGRRKPDPEFFLGLLGELEAAPGKSVMIGDSVDMDLRPASALGMATIWVEGELPRSTDFQPLRVVRSVSELAGEWDRFPPGLRETTA